MSKVTRFIVSILLGFAMLSATACSFSFPGSSGNTPIETVSEPTLEIKTDNVLTYNQTDNYYQLSLISGDSYQINASMGKYKGNDYSLKYEVVSGETAASVSSSGLIKTTANLVEDTSAVISVAIISKKSQTVHSSASIVLMIRKGSQGNVPSATLNITNPNFKLNDDGSYSLALESGEQISLSYSLSVTGTRNYEVNIAVTEANPINCLTISDRTLKAASGLREDGFATVTLSVINKDDESVIASFYIYVTILKDDISAGTFNVKRADNNQDLNDGDKITLFEGDSLSFITTLDNSAIDATISVGNSNLSLDSSSKEVTAIQAGDSTISFDYTDNNEFNYHLAVEVEIKVNTIERIYTENEGESFLYLNGKLVILDKIYAEYSNGNIIDITEEIGLSTDITDKDENNKELTLSFNGASVKYTIKNIETDDINLTNYAYNIRQLRKSMSTGYSTLPLSGEVKILVVPVWLTNSDSFFTENQKPQIIEDINEKMFGNDEWSLKSYYEAESKGKITVSGTVSDFYIDENPSTVYGDEVGFADNAHSLAERVATWYMETYTSDSISNYDLNEDGKFDCIALFYAANFYGNGSDNRSTAFESSLIDYDGLNDPQNLRKVNTFTFCPIGGLYGFNKNSKTSIQLAASDLSQVNPSAYAIGSSVAIHEIGHAFGAEDLYTRMGHSNNSSEEGYEPAGTFSMQKDNVGGHDPMHTNLFGWSSSYILSADDYSVGKKFTIELKDFQSSYNTIVLTPKWNDIDSPFDEYIMLELFTTTGMNQFGLESSRDKCASEPSIRLWHINNLVVRANGDDIGKYYDPTIAQSLGFIGNNYEETEQGYKLAQFIRNDESATLKSKDNFSDNNSFKAGDSFSMEKFSNQFVNQGYLDNGLRLGWEFNVKTILDNEDGTYSAIIEVTRVDNTIIDFEATTSYDGAEITSQEENVHDYTDIFLEDNHDLSIKYALNDGKTSDYYKEKASKDPLIDYNGIYLYPDENNGNGGEIIVSVNEKDGCTSKIVGAEIIYDLVTDVPLTLIANGDTQEGVSSKVYDKWHELVETQRRMTYTLNTSSFSIKNTLVGKYNPTMNVNTFAMTDNHTRIMIVEIKVFYKIIPNDLLDLYGD